MFLSVVFGIPIGFILMGLMNYGSAIFKRDNTDTETERSGLMVLTDHGTGVQYLVTAMGGVTPRLTPFGTPMTSNPEEGKGDD